MKTDALAGGFVDPSIDASRAFRGIMTAMARPGTISTVTGAKPPPPLGVAAGVTVLTLCDPDTPIFLGASLDTPEVRDWITFQTGAPFVSPAQAVFAIGLWDDLPLGAFSLGTSEYPDRSATLIVELPELRDNGVTLTGPGILGAAALSVPDDLALHRDHSLYPRGLDFLFTCADRVAALPRTTRVG